MFEELVCSSCGEKKPEMIVNEKDGWVICEQCFTELVNQVRKEMEAGQ